MQSAEYGPCGRIRGKNLYRRISESVEAAKTHDQPR